MRARIYTVFYLLLTLAFVVPADAATKRRSKKSSSARAASTSAEVRRATLAEPETEGGVPQVRAASVLVIDAMTGRILHEKNADQHRPAASTQKLLTALLVVESGDLDRTIVIEPSDTWAEPTKLYFKPGERYTRRQLLEVLLVHSMNDAARALARDNAGSVEAFANRMNQRAASLGMTESHFVNPNGLPSPGQFSTARDLARLAQAAYQSPTIRRIVAMKSVTFHYADGRVREFKSTNKVLGSAPFCNGMKTGYTEAAGKCLIASGASNGRDVIAVLLGDSITTIWRDAYLLLAWGFSACSCLRACCRGLRPRRDRDDRSHPTFNRLRHGSSRAKSRDPALFLPEMRCKKVRGIPRLRYAPLGMTEPFTNPPPRSRTLEAQLAELRARSLLRKLREVESPQQIEIDCDGKRLLNFSSNDYLGLAAEPFLREAAKAAIDEFGVGAGASRLVCGTLTPHARLEKKLAEFKRTEAALAFSSGYAAAVGTLGALLSRDDVVILDKLAHASLIDGARLSGATVRVFPHNHLGKLESHLQWARKRAPDARVMIVTEAVFSMDGDRAPLAGIVEIKNEFGAMLLLDEAHAVGVIGENGRGLADKLGLTGEIDIQMGTLSKALGVSGGYICGRHVLIEWLINRARSFVYSTAPPPALAAAATAALDFLMSEAGEERRQRLLRNVSQFIMEAPAELLPDFKMQSAIVPVMLGEEATALAAAQWLFESGFLVPAIRYPTVAKGAARLRVTLSAAHTAKQISALAAALGRLQ